MKHLLLLLTLLALFVSQSNASVFINEYSCSNFSLNTDNYTKAEDWIEIYNPNSAPVNIGGYYLSDRLSQPTKWKFPAGTMINSNSFLRVWASGRDESTGGIYHTNFRISQTKFPMEDIVLSDASGMLIDHITIEVTQMHQSRGRKPDGGIDWKVCLTPTPGASNSTSSTVLGYTARPSFDQTPGFYSGAISVAITSPEPGAVIRYTTNGTEPTVASALYSIPIPISSTSVIKAICISGNPNYLPSFVTFGTYFINENHTLPVVSIAGYELDDLANGDQSLRPHGSIEYFNINGVRRTSGYGEFNSHGRDSWANDQRSLDFIMRDEFGYNYALQEQLFASMTPRDEFQRVILRAAGDDNYPASHHASNDGSAHLRDAYVQNLAKTGGLDLDCRIATKSIVYLNGEYWGVYDLREIPDDHDYTDYYYGQGKYKIQYILTWGGTWSEYGGAQAQTDWGTFHDFVMNNDMSIQSNWDFVDSQLDVKSLVDYVIVNSVTVCSDWLNYNTGWWRGLDSTGQHRKWGYILWDNDAVFGFYNNYTGIPDKGPLALPCNVESGLSDPENHIDLLNKLRTNVAFDRYYISRYIDLQNTVFSCENMLRVLDSTKAVIDPEMTRQAQRWFGTYSEWNTNFQDLRSYIDTRCNAFSGLMNTCYSIGGPSQLYVSTAPIGAGSIQINSLTFNNFPWTGNYHSVIPVNLKAIPDSMNGFRFDHWEIHHNPLLPSINQPNAEMTMNNPDTLIAHFSFHTVGVSERDNGFEASAYPNIFGRETTIQFNQTGSEDVDITLYTIVGKPVMKIQQENSSQGINRFVLNLKDKNLAPGIYLLNFKSEEFNKTLRLVFTGE